MITVRKAITLDANSMARLLNDIIRQGGTTAMTRPVTGEDIAERMASLADRSAWHVALDDTEAVQGFQWIAPYSPFPDEACDIATFVRIGKTGLGIGSTLFDATRKAAQAMGYAWINANIRADNDGGLIYYQSRGFRDYGRIENYRLDSGQAVDKVLKRYDIR